MEEQTEVKHHHKPSKDNLLSKPILGLMVLAVVLLLVNQIQVSALSGMISGTSSHKRSGSSGSSDLATIDVNELKSTAHTVAAVFPVQEFASADDAMAAMFPTGTPEYGAELGVSYDDPVAALDALSKMYTPLSAEVKANNPEGWQRFLSLATKPVGISCEYCCGVGPIGIDEKGNSRCGCQHNPALLSVALYLSAYTDYSDGEILREVMQWKTVFFPKNMIELGASLGGGGASTVLENIPSMVGGC
ncbi:hypothetical protein HYW21_02615 [Candidatus Woesearchaeota archaeon]|nr:hypothetical protein [Candidatus Woesearchaeota archaeon]